MYLRPRQVHRLTIANFKTTKRSNKFKVIVLTGNLDFCLEVSLQTICDTLRLAKEFYLRVNDKIYSSFNFFFPFLILYDLHFLTSYSKHWNLILREVVKLQKQFCHRKFLLPLRQELFQNRLTKT